MALNPIAYTEDDNYDLQLLDGAYSMLRPEEHTAMVPQTEGERLENLFKGASDAVNCLVCTPTLELGIDIGQLDSVLMRWAEIPFWRTGVMDFSLPRSPATALREYVPGNLIHANGHRFVARRFHRDLAEEHAGMPYYEISAEKQAVVPSRRGEGSMLGGQVLRAMTVCDADLIHTSHISDEEDLRFQLGVAVYGLELGQHSGGWAFRWGGQSVLVGAGCAFSFASAIGARRARTRMDGGTSELCSSPSTRSSPRSI